MKLLYLILTKKAGLYITFILFASVVACQTQKAIDPLSPSATLGSGLIYKTTPIKIQQPTNFPSMVYDLTKNPLTAEGVSLGKSLFYDTQLSRDTTISCGSCHQQFAGFGHSDHALSHGIDNKFGTRNVPGLQNLGWEREFFWDGKITDLDQLSISPIQNSVEMDLTFSYAIARVQDSPKYPGMFKAAFGSDIITTTNFLKAISQFLLTLVSANSRYDKYIRKENGGDLTSDEISGLSIFQQKCASCHSTDLFTDGSYRNNGLPISKGINDQGRYATTFNEDDRLKFKVPSLRNVEKTLPYMHDGRFANLDQVLDHYKSGVTNSSTLDSTLKINGQLGINLTTIEKRQIIAFLLTLTDDTFIANRAFGAD